MLKFQNKNIQTGRTIVEMLGVLAIIGVLSIGGIAGFRYAMQIYRENETLNAFSVAVAGARTADLMQSYIYSCDNIPCTVNPKSVISTKYPMHSGDFSTAVGSPVMVRIEDTNGYTVRIRGISKELCENIKLGFWGETCAGVDAAGTTHYRASNCDALKELDCSQFQNASGWLTRRSALQEAIDKHIVIPNPEYTASDMSYNSLVLYYGEKTLAGDDYTPGSDTPDPGDSREPGDPSDPNDPDNPGNSDDPGDSDQIPVVTCEKYGGSYKDGKCCKGDFVVNLYTGNVTETPCDSDPCLSCGGSYKDGKCCKGGFVVALPSCNITNESCDPCIRCNGTWVNNICCVGLASVDASSGCRVQTPNEASCCSGAGGTLVRAGHSEICCKLNSSKQIGSNTPTEECCETAGGIWKGSYCCADTAFGQQCKKSKYY